MAHIHVIIHAQSMPFFFPSMPAFVKHSWVGAWTHYLPLVLRAQVPDLPELLAGLRPALDHGRVAILVLEGVIRVRLCGRCRLPPLGGLRMKGSQISVACPIKFLHRMC